MATIKNEIYPIAGMVTPALHMLDKVLCPVAKVINLVWFNTEYFIVVLLQNIVYPDFTVHAINKKFLMMVECVICCGLTLRVNHQLSSHCNVLIVFDYRYSGMGCESQKS